MTRDSDGTRRAETAWVDTGVPASPSGFRPSDGATQGVSTADAASIPNAAYTLLRNPDGQAAFMLPRLDEAQREFIVRMKPTLSRQRVSKRDHENVWPGVNTGEEWPDQFWFGGGYAHYPAGRPPIGNKRASYGFRFNEAGLLLRAAIATEAQQGGDKGTLGSVHEGAGLKGIAHD